MKKKKSARFIAGVDEAGIGPLAGPVVAAAVIFDVKRPIAVADSKALTLMQREAIYQEIIENCVAYAVGIATVEEIDRINILQANLLAMKRAIEQLSTKPTQILVDGRNKPAVDIPTMALVGGDQSVAMISAASIIAKVTRDRLMIDYDEQFPEYGFAAHKGYGTRLHLEKLKEFGPCALHRKSFAPVKALLIAEEIVS